MRLVLASSSPRRQELLRTLRLDFEVRPADVDETRLPDEAPATYVERVARAKAEVAAGDGLLVIAADTTVVHEGRVMGKPGHPAEARSMLRRLQGQVHEVFTGVAVAAWEGVANVRSLVDVTEVEFLPMTDEEIDAYVETGEPMDKAGAYAMQGLGSVFIGRVSGSPFTVIGLPVHLLPRLFAASGAEVASFRTATGG
jgi:septum formation protein